MTRASINRVLGVVAVALLLSPGAQGYYHFVRYLSRTAPWNPVVERFDLNALQNKTVPFLIAEQGPALQAGDTFAGLVSQIRLAAKAWNDVESSDLRLAFGGFFGQGATQSTPAIKVVFDELPPGVLAKGGPTTKADPTDGGSGVFVPIVESTLILPATFDQPSWGEEMFLRTVHEFGHCLGLQHTLTSSVMSTATTRGTTKAEPLADDDVAGLTQLYPGAGARANVGSITGRVVLAGAGVNLASVVALSLDGPAVSALTNPDGTYRIDGVRAGTYYVYVHPLPPMVAGQSYDADIIPPRDLDGRLLGATTSFNTQFFPGTREPTDGVAVRAGEATERINFTVTRRAAPAVFGVQTFSFPGQVAVRPAHLTANSERPFIVASGYGLSPRASVGVIGGSAVIPAGGVRAYQQDARFVQMDVQFSFAAGQVQGPRHLSFSVDNDLYILPAAFRLTRVPPPVISSVGVQLDASVGRVAVISGSNLRADTRILFSGVPAQVRSADDASITVIPPPGVPGETVRVVALNRDGQSSLFVQSQPQTYEFESADASSFVVSPSSLPAGAETVVEVTGINGAFSQAYSTIAFGSSAVQVRRIWVTGPNRMLVNVAVAPNATPGASTVSVTNGLRILSLPSGFQVTAAPARLSMLRSPITEAETGRTEIPAGALATVRLAGPLADVASASLAVTVGDRPATGVQNVGGTLSFRLPVALTPGPAIVRVSAGSESALPLALAVDVPLPVVNFATISGTRVDLQRPARPNELVVLNVSGLADVGAEVSASRVTVTVGVARHTAVQVSPSNGSHQVQFLLDPGVGTGPQTLTVAIDGRVSAPYAFPVRGN